MPLKSIPEPWKSFLEEVDGRAEGAVALHCLGGFVVTMLYGLGQSTADVDVITIAPGDFIEKLIQLAGKGSALHRKYGIYQDSVTTAAVPEDYDRCLVEILPESFQRPRLFALDPYDIALSKLERNIQRDRDDAKYLARTVPFDLNVLRERYESELRPYLEKPEREDLTLRLWLEALEEALHT